ncbi:hypothetical protein AA101099_2772 [Neoasaia chiangmaiensis NBRC 101099]|nr:hypothetical protein AA101099_2772 [Neoasaia chiangmaiensis NBRC 101099]
MISAPSVNQMRFFSSVAFAKELTLRLAASCSADEAIHRSFHKNSVAAQARDAVQVNNGTRNRKHRVVYRIKRPTRQLPLSAPSL